VKGIGGTFGSNSEPTSGGGARRTLEDLRAIARKRTREVRPIVTSRDLESAARALPDLVVRRAVEVSDPKTRRPVGHRVLVVVGARDSDSGAEADSPDWLKEIRAQLAPRLPLGQRLEVIEPQYVKVRITAKLIASRTVSPKEVGSRAEEMLRKKFAAVAPVPGDSEWPFGRDVTLLAIKGWLRHVEGVAKVVEVSLYEGQSSEPKQTVVLGPIALPQLEISAVDITVERAPSAVTR
jgi:predicted phage baseplate assembly protein